MYIKKFSQYIILYFKGHVYQIGKQKKAEDLKNIETVKHFISKSRYQSKIDSIKKARELIFEDSCYGRQLLRYTQY